MLELVQELLHVSKIVPVHVNLVLGSLEEVYVLMMLHVPPIVSALQQEAAVRYRMVQLKMEQ